MNNVIFSSVFLSLLFAIPAYAQNAAGDTVEEQLEKEPETYNSKDKIMTLVVENDLFGGNGTDENYTSGIALEYLDVNVDIPAYGHYLASFIPTFDINETTNIYYSIGQNLYSPSDITQSTQIAGERPWAAHLYGTVGMATTTDNHTDEVELSLGVVGPLALGEQSQKLVHKYITTDSPTPQGWDNQIKNEPAFLIGWQREHNQYMSLEAAGLSLNASPYYGATLGNVYTFADAGINFSLKPEAEKFQDNPVRVRPGLPGTGLFQTPEEHWSWYLFSGIEGRAVARNIFLDGNTFRESYSVDKKVFVADANIGVAFTYDDFRFSYTLVYRTKEFNTQDDAAVFGAFNFGYRF